MSADNSEMITLYFFISAFLLGCGCHICHICQKCSHTNQRVQLDTQEQDVEMDSITNVLYTNNIINELDHFSIVPKMDNYSNKDECVICTEKMEEQQVRILKCSHHFHQNCIDEWILTSQKLECPICGLNLTQHDDHSV